MLGKLLHNLCKVDGRKEISPREISEEIDIFLMLLSIGKNRGASYGLPWRLVHAILKSIWMGVLNIMKLTVAEETKFSWGKPGRIGRSRSKTLTCYQERLLLIRQ